MEREYVKQKLRAAGALVIILILLPYIVTVFVHGADMKGSSDNYVKVKTEDDSGGENILNISWSEYLSGVLAKEVSDYENTEFLKAQAVVLRTELFQYMESGEDNVMEEAFFTAGDMEKKFGSMYETYYENLKTAVEETGNQVLFYNDTYALVPYHQSSNGMTRTYSEVLGTQDCPYLVSKECPLDKEAEDETHVTIFSYKEIQMKCQSLLVAVAEGEEDKIYGFEDFEILSYDSAGYVKEIRIGETTMSGDQFRDALSLPSGSFSLQEDDDGIRITTMGNGHGLGMSQWTAIQMAEKGSGYEEILQYFYEGTTIVEKDNVMG